MLHRMDVSGNEICMETHAILKRWAFRLHERWESHFRIWEKCNLLLQSWPLSVQVQFSLHSMPWSASSLVSLTVAFSQGRDRRQHGCGHWCFLPQTKSLITFVSLCILASVKNGYISLVHVHLNVPRNNSTDPKSLPLSCLPGLVSYYVCTSVALKKSYLISVSLSFPTSKMVILIIPPWSYYYCEEYLRYYI